MKGRIHNARVDVEIEGDSREDILEQFAHDYPEQARHTVHIEWSA